MEGPDQILPATSLTMTDPEGAVKFRHEETLLDAAPISVPTMLRKTAKKYPGMYNIRRGNQGDQKAPKSLSVFIIKNLNWGGLFNGKNLIYAIYRARLKNRPQVP